LLKGAPYDVLFIDAAKAQYRKFFEKYIDLVKDDGVVIVDNLDFHGMLEHPETIGNRNTKALVRKIERFRKWIVENDDYHVDYIPVGDGLCTITKAKHKLKLALHLNDASYLHDYLVMGVDRMIVAGPMSAYSSHKFSLEEIEAISARAAETYVMVNGLYDEHELPALRRLIDAYAKMNIKGLLFQDFGVLHYVKNRYDFRMMYAPNTLNTNYMTLNVLEDLGVDSAWVAKEIPLEEQIAIKKHTHLPIMIQGHGVQYMMSSKRHLLKSYAKAAHKEFNQDNVILHARESDYATHIYEDERGTTIFSVNKLYTLDLLNEMSVFDYLYIETNYMSAIEAIEVTHMYSECLKALNEVGVQEYVHKMKDYLPMLREISKPLDRGFLNDETLYRLEDVKRRDNHGAM
ncbi:MAG: U32 family peptidase, partial [Intestinibaculum porci]|uniref:U32 family peptidase n=1 Tax=Intestinibaculum porci TaxID=2487118 RepID=UPI00240A6ED8